MTLVADVRHLLEAARHELAGSGVETEIDGLLTRLDGPLRVAIAGRVKAGKSTLLNALVGSHVAATDARECTRIVTWYRHGPTHAATALLRSGANEPLSLEADDNGLTIELGATQVDDVHAIHVFWPSDRLQTMSLIDTPGVGSMTPDASARSYEFLGGSGQEAEADAVLYLLKHLHSADLDLLSAFHDEEVSHPNPVNAIGILSRADEIGAGRLDAMESASRVAERISSVPTIRRLVSSVLPVCGLLAETAATLRDDEYELLARIAALPHDQRGPALLSVERFRALNNVDGLGADERERLLARFAIFGLRSSIAAIAGGAATSPSDLAHLLHRLSGIAAVRQLLDSVFAERGDVLKARSALVGLGAALERVPEAEATPELFRQLEQLVASAHEIAELRALSSMRLGLLDEDEHLLVEAERLVGGNGHAPERRLAMLDASTNQQMLDEANERLAAWQRRAEHPLSSKDLVSLCRVVVRSCEGLISSLLAAQATHPPTTHPSAGD